MRREYWILHIHAGSTIEMFKILLDKEIIKEWIKRNYESGAIDAQLEQILHYDDVDEFIEEDFDFTYNLIECEPNIVKLNLVYPEETWHPFAEIHLDHLYYITYTKWEKTDCFYI